MTVRFGVSLVCAGLPVLTAGPLQAQTVTSLPLQRGFYVEAKTACGGASNATLVVVTKDGMNRAQVVDRFTKIDKIGPTTYRVAAVRTFIRSQRTESSTATFEIPNATSFRGHYQDGSADFRFCAQTSLPEPWRNNDIRALIN